MRDYRIFNDRREAGRLLADALDRYRGRDDVLVLALPRGGLPVAFEVARSLGAPLDVLIVRKLGTPGQPELAMGAVASGGVRVLNDEVVSMLHIDEAAIQRVAEREEQELKRRELAYRGNHGLPDMRGLIVILVDDGLATGSTMRAGIRALRQLGPGKIVIAVPHGPPDTCETVRAEADELVCLEMPDPYLAVGCWYRSFPQLEDDEVRAYLQKARETMERNATGSQ
jgi:putative phosphoribosyl transferase